MSDTETRPSQQRGLKPWLPGQSGNPAGRPKGARHKLGEKFLEDMLADFETHGKAVIEKVRTDDPTQYLKVVASILPKELNVTVSEYDDLSDDELAERFAAIASQLGNGGGAHSVRAPAADDAARGARKPH